LRRGREKGKEGVLKPYMRSGQLFVGKVVQAKKGKGNLLLQKENESRPRGGQKTNA